jgi:hypothetical protein
LEISREGVREGDTLEAAVHALAGIIHFLDHDDRQLSEPLNALLNALHDVSVGARAPFFDRKTEGDKGGRRADKAFCVAQGAIGACVEMLCVNGSKPDDAARTVARELTRLKFQGPNTKSAIVSLRKNLRSGRAAKLATDIYRDILQRQPCGAITDVRRILQRLTTSGL